MNRIHYTKPEMEKILSIVNFDEIEEPVLIGKWNKKTTKELGIEIKVSDATINRALKRALDKIKDAYDKNLIKF